jgi:hypothetical protein
MTRLEEIRENLSDNHYCDNPNCSDVNGDIALLLECVDEMRGALEFCARHTSEVCDVECIRETVNTTLVRIEEKLK